MRGGNSGVEILVSAWKTRQTTKSKKLFVQVKNVQNIKLIVLYYVTSTLKI